MEDEFETRKFINEKINPILEKLVVDMLIHRPTNPVQYFIALILSFKNSLPTFTNGAKAKQVL